MQSQTTQHSLAGGVHNSPFLAFTHALRPLDPGMQLHPAFFHPLYPMPTGFSPVRPANLLHSAAHERTKSFTIDAILGREAGAKMNDPSAGAKENSAPKDGVQLGIGRGGEALSGMHHPHLGRSHARLSHQVSHPYLGPISCGPGYTYRPQPTAFSRGKSNDIYAPYIRLFASILNIRICRSQDAGLPHYRGLYMTGADPGILPRGGGGQGPRKVRSVGIFEMTSKQPGGGDSQPHGSATSWYKGV